jgi:ABC-type transporter Mla subunit MlaD
MSDDNKPRIIVESDGGGSRGLLVGILVLVLVVAAAVWFFSQNGSGQPSTEVTIELPAGEVDPGTETTISP